MKGTRLRALCAMAAAAFLLGACGDPMPSPTAAPETPSAPPAVTASPTLKPETSPPPTPSPAPSATASPAPLNGIVSMAANFIEQAPEIIQMTASGFIRDGKYEEVWFPNISINGIALKDPAEDEKSAELIREFLDNPGDVPVTSNLVRIGDVLTAVRDDKLLGECVVTQILMNCDEMNGLPELIVRAELQGTIPEDIEAGVTILPKGVKPQPQREYQSQDDGDVLTLTADIENDGTMETLIWDRQRAQWENRDEEADEGKDEYPIRIQRGGETIGEVLFEYNGGYLVPGLPKLLDFDYDGTLELLLCTGEGSIGEYTRIYQWTGNGFSQTYIDESYWP